MSLFHEEPCLYLNPTQTEWICFGRFDALRHCVHRWSRNRPVDPIRVRDIADSIRETGIVDGPICIAFLQEEGYVIWDGLHRFEALKSLTDIERPENVYYHFIQSTTQEDLTTRFILMNRSIPVSSLYTETNDICMRQIIENVVNRMMSMWPNHFKSSRNPQQGFINRDILMEHMAQRLDGITLTEQFLWTKIEEHNKNVREKVESGVIHLSETIMNRCYRTNCYLFLKECPVWKFEL